MKNTHRFIFVNIVLIHLFWFNTQAEQIEWVQTFGGKENERIDHVLSCPNYDVIVIGTFSDSLFFKNNPDNFDTLFCENNFKDVFIARFDSYGNFLWSISLEHGSRNFDWWLFPAVDSDGNLLLGGRFLGEITIGKNLESEIHFNSPDSNSTDIFLTRILSNGQIDWAVKIGDKDQENLSDIAVDNLGAVYLTGSFWSASIFFPGGISDDIILTNTSISNSVFTVKYDKFGNLIWANNIVNNYDLLSYSVAVSESKNVSIAGYFLESIIFNSEFKSNTLTSKGLTDIFIATYDSAGNYLWAISEGGSSFDTAHDLVYDTHENIVVTGYFQGMMVMGSIDTLRSDNTLFEDDDIFLAKYDSEGNYLWSDGAGGSFVDWGERIQIFKDDYILLSGSYWIEMTFSKNLNSKVVSNIADTSSHFAAKYTPDGVLTWAADVDSLFYTFNTNIVIDGSENVLRAGEYYNDILLQSEENSLPVSSKGGSDIYLAKFVDVGTAIPIEKKTIPDFILYQNYPNPFNPQTNVEFIVPESGDVILSVYNILGQKIKTITDKKIKQGRHKFNWNGDNDQGKQVSSGIYILQLKYGNDILTKRMLLIR